MSTIVRFPARHSAAVFIYRERDADGWLAILGTAGWLFGSLSEARREAHWLSRNFGLPVREVAL